MRIFWFIIKILFYIAFLLGFAFVAGKLFFPDFVDFLSKKVVDKVYTQEETKKVEIEEFRALFADEPDFLEPTLLDSITRQRTVNIFEPLIKMDRDLNLRSGLALSWGTVDDLTWDFRLRNGVKFHDGSNFDAEDVVASFKRAINYDMSHLASILENIKEIKVKDVNNIQIITHNPDPLMLQKLSYLFIIPSEYEIREMNVPIGTASYKFVSWKKGEDLLLERFNDYWGPKPPFQRVRVVSKPNIEDRLEVFFAREADFLTNIPQDVVEIVRRRGMAISSVPSLEVQFLLFNMNSAVLQSRAAREAIFRSVDGPFLAQNLGEFVRPVTQFVSNGVFGYNPEIVVPVFDLGKAKGLTYNAGLKGKTLNVFLPKDSELIGEHLKNNLKESGIAGIVSYISPEKYAASIESGKADIFMLGYKTDYADSSDFLNTILHSKGVFNLSHYSNSEVDNLIESSFGTLYEQDRQYFLQRAMKIVVDEDIAGIPLFEYELIYAMVPEVELQPRLDGLIIFDEFKIK